MAVLKPCSVNSRRRSILVCSGVHICAPSAFNAASNGSAIDVNASTADSLVQRIELSNDFEATMRLAASLMSALSSTSTGALPGPTPIAGLPER